MSQFFTSGGQSIRASASASVLPMNIQDWFLLELTGFISLQSKGLSRVSSNTTAQKHQFRCSVSSVTQSCPTLCNPMECRMPGFPVHHQLPEFTQTYVHWIGDAIQPPHPLLSPSPPSLNLYQHQSLFKWVSSLHQVAKVLEFQLQHQSFQWILRTVSLLDGLGGSPCSPRDSQEFSPTLQFKSWWLIISCLKFPFISLICQLPSAAVIKFHSFSFPWTSDMPEILHLLRGMYHINYYYCIPIIIIILEILKGKFKNQVSSDSISYNMLAFIFPAPMKTSAYYSFPKCTYHNSFWRIIKPFIDNSDSDSDLSYAKIFHIEKCYKFINVCFSVTFFYI